MNIETKTYETSDLYLSAFLKVRGLRLLNQRRAGNKIIFIFADCSDRAEIVSEYFNNGQVGVTNYRSALADLKTLIFSA